MGEKPPTSVYTQTALYEVPSVTVAAHELKAPLALLRQISLLLQDLPAEQQIGDANVQQLLERLTLTSERSLRLVEMITKHSRLEDGLFALEPINANHICEEVAHELDPLSQALGRSLRLKLPQRAPLVVANRDLLRSVLLGLCDNALAYGSPGRPIEIAAVQQHEMVRLVVRDYGPPISAQVFQQLRSSLGRTAQPIAKRPNSSGLGLYIAGQFAAAMHSELGVIRHRGQGASFYVATPQSQQLSLLA